MKQCSLIIIFLLNVMVMSAQTLGGSTIFNFARLSNTPQLTALGGINISNRTSDIGLVFQNPALLRPDMHTQANLVFNSMYGGIRNYHVQFGYRSERLKTNFAFGIHYFNYGSLAETDASGNVLGAFKPVDYVAQLSMSRSYLTRWTYGAGIKFLRSDYGSYRAAGLAIDLAVAYYDSANGIQSSFVIKNMGTQIQRYAGTGNAELPFDLQVGISKRLKNAPFQFSFAAKRLHRFDVTYNDTAFNNDNGYASTRKTFSFDNIFRHIVLSTQVYITDKLELSIGYSYLRRQELNIGETGNGLNGFSAGIGVLFRKLQLRYGRSYYQSNRSYHQVGLNFRLNDYLHLGKTKMAQVVNSQ